jgi:hypothetical protein
MNHTLFLFSTRIVMTAREWQPIIQIKARDVKIPKQKNIIVSSIICKQLKKNFNSSNIIFWRYIIIANERIAIFSH